MPVLRKLAVELFLSIFLGGKRKVYALQRFCQPPQRIPLQEVFEKFRNGFLRRKNAVEFAELNFLLLEIGDYFCADFAFGFGRCYLFDDIGGKSHVALGSRQTLPVLVFYGFCKELSKIAVFN